tara:strand:- start:3145 stop:3348 length:204 start_codon:yes stop_codon:yes gene_type:complete
MSDLRIKPNMDNGDLPKKKDLFSDDEINSDKTLHISFEDIEDDPKQLIDILNKRNQYHNSKVSRSEK